MKKTGIFALLIALCMIAGAFAGCSGSGGGSSEGAAPAATSETGSAPAAEEPAQTGGEDALLQVLWFSDGGEGDTFRRLADRYSEENPHVTIEMIEVPYDEMNNRIKNMLAAGQPPAIARLTSIAEYQNQLIDLRDYVEAGAGFADNFLEGGLKFIFKDKMIGAPMETTANGLIYNKTAFDNAGVEVPSGPDDVWTWEEFEEALKQVVASGEVKYGLAYDRTPQRFSTLMYQAGGSMLNEDQTEPNFSSDGTRRAVEWFKSLHDQNIIPDSVWLGAEDPNNLFRTGQVACHLGGSWLVTNYVKEISDFEWGVTYMPYETQRSSIPGGKYLTVFDNTGVEKEAALFVEWLCKPENNAEYCSENYFISQVVGNESIEYDFGSEFFEIFNNELSVTSTTPGNEWGFQEFTSKIQTDLRDSLAEVLAGSMTVDDYLEEMDAKAAEILEEIG